MPIVVDPAVLDRKVEELGTWSPELMGILLANNYHTVRDLVTETPSHFRWIPRLGLRKFALLQGWVGEMGLHLGMTPRSLALLSKIGVKAGEYDFSSSRVDLNLLYLDSLMKGEPRSVSIPVKEKDWNDNGKIVGEITVTLSAKLTLSQT